MANQRAGLQEAQYAGALETQRVKMQEIPSKDTRDTEREDAGDLESGTSHGSDSTATGHREWSRWRLAVHQRGGGSGVGERRLSWTWGGLAGLQVTEYGLQNIIIPGNQMIYPPPGSESPHLVIDLPQLWKHRRQRLHKPEQPSL